jgi:hypothetical protein
MSAKARHVLGRLWLQTLDRDVNEDRRSIGRRETFELGEESGIRLVRICRTEGSCKISMAQLPTVVIPVWKKSGANPWSASSKLAKCCRFSVPVGGGPFFELTSPAVIRQMVQRRNDERLVQANL